MIPNFYIVDTKRNIRRGGQPVGDDYKTLSGSGITKIVKLNTESEGSDQQALDIGMSVFLCPIPFIEQIITGPDEQKILAALDFIDDNTFIHCGSVARTLSKPDIKQPDDRGGNDRTGYLVARWRVKNGWSKFSAHLEALRFNFHWEELGLDKAWAEVKE